jgi:hypothetical protein
MVIDDDHDVGLDYEHDYDYYYAYIYIYIYMYNNMYVVYMGIHCRAPIPQVAFGQECPTAARGGGSPPRWLLGNSARWLREVHGLQPSRGGRLGCAR